MSESRVNKELQEIRRDPRAGVTVEVDSGTHNHFIGVIKGPDGTPFEGGVYRIDITLPSDYPFAPPKMKFITKLWHPNVSSQTGAICLDILKDQWSPALTIKTALLSIQALLTSPEPHDPQDAEVANMYLSDPETYASTAKFWTECYAQPREEGGAMSAVDASVQRLVDMGFPEDASRRAIAKHRGDENAAVNEIVSNM